MKLVTVVATTRSVQLPIRKFLQDTFTVCLPRRVPIPARGAQPVLPSTNGPLTYTTSAHFAFFRLQNGLVTASSSVGGFVARRQQRKATS
jgi:hypothetical protein